MMKAALVAACTLALVACETPTNPTTITINNNQTVSGAASPTPAPGATPPGTGAPVASVSVGFYGRSCPSGTPPAAPNDLRVGCSGSITATPKDVDGTPMSPADHGPVIHWFYEYGAGVLPSSPSPSNDFNRNASAAAAGTYRLCAEVKGVIGCMEGTVLP
jgi:hypothetical protein